MSNDDGLTFWVGDLDGYVTIRPDDDAEFVCLEHDQDEFARDDKLGSFFECPADLRLLSGDFVSDHLPQGRGITDEEWTWAKHQAEGVVGHHAAWSELEPLLLKDLLSLGQRYAVARYAKWEELFYPTALAATFPYGLAAIVDQFLQSQGLTGNSQRRTDLHGALRSVSKAQGLTAYRRTGMFQSAIHQLANDLFGPKGYLDLNISAMRSLLSLARLHYSVGEIRVRGLEDLARVHQLYEQARLEVREGSDQRPPILGRHIQNWSIRHLRPLTDLYPFSIRTAFGRGISHRDVTTELPDRSMVINELTLARCEIILMKRKARGRSSQA